jgi:hypothetical protein
MQDSDRIAQMASQLTTFAGKTATDDRQQSDFNHSMRLCRDELTRLSVAATRNSAGTNVASTSDTFVSLAQVPDSNKLTSTYSWTIG